MKFETKEYEVKKLVTAWKHTTLIRNDEYQRGAAWTKQQKQGLVDSIFRKYPIPALFIHRVVESGGLGAGSQERFEVVDGQQRIRALADYLDGKFALLNPQDKKLRLPASMRSRPVDWADKKFAELPPSLRTELENTRVRVYELDAEKDDDEIRDLFIRLQSGTALGRQQIRDAWPGKIGPFVNRLAGKLDSSPSCGLFAAVDLRGQRMDDEGEKDEYVADRQTCAQLLRLFLLRESDPAGFAGVSATDLDALYHDYTAFDENSQSAQRFLSCLTTAEQVIKKAVSLRASGNNERQKKKFRKLEVVSLVCLVQDLTRNPAFKVTNEGIKKVAEQMVNATREGEPGGKTTSGRSIRAYYDWWRTNVVAAAPGVHLDERRVFSSEQKEELRKRQGGKCPVCNLALDDGEGEGDHFPVPHRDGGPTEISNGRLVHFECHPRGRPVDED